LNILYNDDVTGTTVNYIDVGGIKGIPLLKVMNLDTIKFTVRSSGLMVTLIL
ncbi:MAG: hypothetical protein HC831_09205, partial [Chloroflexia bacterium]|nr:hypothetical protein [Chloroflexia bacterium]